MVPNGTVPSLYTHSHTLTHKKIHKTFYYRMPPSEHPTLTFHRHRRRRRPETLSDVSKLSG